MLSDSESGVDDVHQLTLNEHFAKAYAYKKEREELSNLKDKYGSDLEEGGEVSEDSEEDTTEDEEGEELTPAVDAAILRTLARIKRKDPAIYEVDKDVFEDSKAEEQQKTKGSFSFNTQKDKHKSKPLLMRQHVLNSTIKSTSRSPSPSPAEPTHAQEQAELRKETISAFHSALAGDGTAEDEDDILIPREKTKDEIEREQEEYREFLTREVGEDISGLVTVEEGGNVKMNVEDEDGDEGTEDVAEESEKKKKKKKKTKGKKTKEEADHEFLMNYILGRGWIDHSTRHVPTYNEVTDSRRNEDEDGAGRVRIVSVKSSLGEDAEGDGDFDEEEFDEVLDTFESSYNFALRSRADAFKIPAHPRTIDSTVRREENPRKEARERKKQRKEEKILQKREEVKRLKALKMKEIREKLERIGKEGGKSIDDEALAQLDLDGDWDPDAYDTQMKGIYGGEDESELGEDDVDLEKPSWDDDIDITNVIPTAKNDLAGPSTSKKKKKKDKKKKNGDADEDGVDIDMMDADFLGVEGNDFEEGASTSKQKRKELDAHMDDVYGLEFNDMVGDMPTRFKYMPVLPQTYGLDPVEILLADDADLNNVVGLRTLAPYRRDKGRTWDANRSEKLQELRSQLREKRNFAVGSGGTNTKWSGSGVQNEEEERPAKKRKGKKERLKAKATSTEATEDTSGVGDATDDVKRPQ